MKISDVFDSNGKGGVRAKKQVTIKSPMGGAGTLSPGSELNGPSSIGGTSAEWILANMEKDVPDTWVV